MTHVDIGQLKREDFAVAPKSPDSSNPAAFWGIPTAGLKPEQLDNVTLVDEAIRVAHFEYDIARETFSDNPQPRHVFDGMAFFLTDGKITPLIEEAKKRAEAGSNLAASFLTELETAREKAKPLYNPEGCEPVRAETWQAAQAIVTQRVKTTKDEPSLRDKVRDAFFKPARQIPEYMYS